MKFEIFIQENWMMGGLRKDLRKWNQRKIGTIYWKDNKTRNLYWLLVPGEGKADVIVTHQYFSIFAKWFQKSIKFFVHGNNLDDSMFKDRQWTFPGITFSVYPHKSDISIRKIENIEDFRTQWAIADVLNNVYEITCKFRRKLIRQQAITIEPSP
jgi:hypothetical protein